MVEGAFVGINGNKDCEFEQICIGNIVCIEQK